MEERESDGRMGKGRLSYRSLFSAWLDCLSAWLLQPPRPLLPPSLCVPAGPAELHTLLPPACMCCSMGWDRCSSRL